MQKVNEIDELIKARQRDLGHLNATINERARYHRDQERIIADTIESGNNELLGLSYEIKVATAQLRDIKIDIRSALQDKKLILEEVSSMVQDNGLQIQPALVFVSAIT